MADFARAARCGPGPGSRDQSGTGDRGPWAAPAVCTAQISCYRVVTDPAKLSAYAQLAGPAIEAGGGRFLARTMAARAFEDGKVERTVIIEVESVEQAIATHDSAGYQAALAALADGAVRDLRIVPGV